MARPPIDRAKLRAAIRRLGDEYVYFMLDEALDLLPGAKLSKLVAQYINIERLQPDGPRSPDALAHVKRFEKASLAHEYFESFDVNSKNYMQKSSGTRAWIAECRRLFDLLMKEARRENAAPRVCEGFEIPGSLLRRIDAGEDQMLFWADEGGSWEVGVDWREVMPLWFRCLARTTGPEEYARRVGEIIEQLDDHGREKHWAAARRVAGKAHRKALQNAARGNRA